MSNWYRPAAQSRLQELPSGSKAARVGGLGQHFTDRLRLPRQPWENIAARHQFIGWKSQAIQNLPVLVLKRERTQAQILHHHMNHIMQASLLAEGICALAHVLLADVGPHAATATCEIFHVWPPPSPPRIQDPKVQDASKIQLLRIAYTWEPEATQQQNTEKGSMQERFEQYQKKGRV